MKKIVVLGAGYAGITTVRNLSKKLKKEEAQIVLINKYPYHYQTTWLHEVAAGSITPQRASIKINEIIDQNKVEIIIDEAISIKKEEKVVELRNQDVSYDYLVVSLGFETNTFGIKGAKEHAFFIQDIASSARIAEHIEERIKHYANSSSKDEADLTVLVGGGGFTGVEFVGELSLHLPKLARKYGIDPTFINIINVEGSPHILASFHQHPKLVAYAQQLLSKRGITIKENTSIKEFTQEGIIIGEERELLKGNTIVWTGGVTGNPILSTLGIELTRGKVAVTKELHIPNQENIFVIGDCAWVEDESGKPYPPTAQAAVQHGICCAKNIVSKIRGKKAIPFVFHQKGSVASIGKTKGIGAIFGGIEVKGNTGAFLKKVVDDRSLLLLGGLKFWKKKTKFKK